MSASVEIRVSGTTGSGDLLEPLGRHGFPASRVEVSSPREDTSRLVADLNDVIRGWIPESSPRPHVNQGGHQ